jgi:hypothetical protein
VSAQLEKPQHRDGIGRYYFEEVGGFAITALKPSNRRR